MDQGRQERTEDMESAQTVGKNVLACSDYSTNECGDIVISIYGDDYISIQKEKCGTIVLSFTTFIRMYNKWMSLKVIERLKD